MPGDHFQGTGTINLQPGSSNVPYRFNVTVASSSRKNDGAIPYGSTVCAFTISEHPARHPNVSSTLICVTKSIDKNELVPRFSWTTAVNRGHYHLTFKVTATVNGSTVTPMVRHFDFDRIYVKDR
jgi:hypothetical protein